MASRIIRNVARRTMRFVSSDRASNNSHRTFVSVSVPLAEKFLMKVPTMGDSITEGTIVEWTASVGQAVKDGDVIALVETDKVTVEIKAEIDGVIMQHFGNVDDTVEVGANLYEIDTDAEASVISSVASDTSDSSMENGPEEISEGTPQTKLPEIALVKMDQSHRTPSIKFLGKEGWDRLRSSGLGTASPAVYALPPNYGRPRFTEDEMDALLQGGANLSPERQSGGAVFGY